MYVGGKPKKLTQVLGRLTIYAYLCSHDVCIALLTLYGLTLLIIYKVYMRMRQRVLLTLTLLATLLTGAKANELTVYDGTETSQYAPIWGSHMYWQQKCEFLMPATDLTAMTDNNITGMTFYLETPATEDWSGLTVRVYLREVENTTLNANNGFMGIEGSQMVYEGGLDARGSTMAITFDNAYAYSGGNLLICIYKPDLGGINNDSEVEFLGIEHHVGCLQNGEYNEFDNLLPVGRVFLPKTTFDYSSSSCQRPTEMTVSTTPGTATVSWESDADTWDIEVNGVVTSGITTKSYDFSLNALESYTVRVRTNCGGGSTSAWTAAKSFTAPLCESDNQVSISYTLTDSYGDGWNGASIIIKHAATGNNVATLTVPTSQKAVSGTVPLCCGEVYDFVWVKGSYDKECSFIFNDMNGNKIEAVSDASILTENQKFAYYSFDCNAIVKDITTEPSHHSATISWTGGADSYKVRYWKAGTNGITDSFENGLDQWTIYTNNQKPSDRAAGWFQLNPKAEVYDWMSAHTGSYVASSCSWYNVGSTSLNADNWLITPSVNLGGTVSFWVYAEENDEYEVLLSTTGNKTSDFTTVLRAMAPVTDKQMWFKETFDLTAYAGQKGYIAIHHKDYQEYYLYIDDFSLPNPLENEIVTTGTSVELTGLEPNTTYEVQIISIIDEVEKNITNVDPFTTKTVSELPNDGNNESTLTSLLDQTLDVELTGRTLYNNTRWNTICLPFDVDLTADGPLKGATAKTLSSVTTDGATVTISFADAGTTLKAGDPYFVVTDNGTDLTNPIFENATIEYQTPSTVSVTGANLVGTFSPYTLTAGSKNMLYLQNNLLYWPETGDATINAFRAYIQLDEAVAAPMQNVILDMGDGIQTSLRQIDNGQWIMDNEGGNWYTLDGRQLHGKPMQKGVYVKDGKKVVIK